MCHHPPSKHPRHKKRPFIVICLLASLLSIYFVPVVRATISSTGDIEPTITLVWKIAPTTPYPSEHETFFKQRENALNVVLQDQNAGYRIRIEQIGVFDEALLQLESDMERDDHTFLLYHTGYVMPARADVLREIRDANTQADIVTLIPPATFGEPTSYQSTWLDVARSNLLLPLDTLIASPAGKSLRENLLSFELDMAKVDGTTFGLRTFQPAHMQCAYNLDLIDHLQIDERTLDTDWFANKSLFETVRDQYDVTPFEWYERTYPNYCLNYWIVEPTHFLAFSENAVFENIYEISRTKDYFKTLSTWKQSKLLTLQNVTNAAGDYLPFAFNTSITTAVAPYQAKTEFRREINVMIDGEPTTVVIDEVRDVLMVPNLNVPYLGFDAGDINTGIAAWTEHEALAFDFLTRMFSDPAMANAWRYGRAGMDELDTNETDRLAEMYYAQVHGGFTNIRLLEDQSGELKTATQNFADTWFSRLPIGFRFDPAPVDQQIIAINRLFDVNLDTYSIHAAKLFRLEFEDLDETLHALIDEMKHLGIDDVIEEANNQLTEWKQRTDN